MRIISLVPFLTFSLMGFCSQTNDWVVRSLPFQPPNAVRRSKSGSGSLAARANWVLKQPGTTGVSAMQLTVVSNTQILIFDKVENNPLKTPTGGAAWASLYNMQTNVARPAVLQTDSFCAGGSWLANGTMVSIGGDGSGFQAIRQFNPATCSDTATSCTVFEDPGHLHLQSNRWYPTSIRLDDGTLIVIGGATSGGFIDSASMDNPTYEFYPSKGALVQSPFLVSTLNSNLFPHAFLLPDGRLFIAANRNAILYDWRNNVETQLPIIPNGVRVAYPMSGSAIMLPLTPANSYTPTILLCGGSTISDTIPSSSMSSQTPASNQCSRITLTTAGIAAGWSVETMPFKSTMPNIVTLPDGKMVVLNGAQTGVAGYGNVANQVGQSNADNPEFQPMLYDPAAASGSRFSTAGIPASTIPRLYHSTASLTPNASVVIAGSNPNAGVTSTKYATEYRLETLEPPYLQSPRPTYTGLPTTIRYGVNFSLTVSLPTTSTSIQVSLMDLGFSTHGVQMNTRLVVLAATLSASRTTLTITGPPNAKVYPPGPAFLYILQNGIPSVGQKVSVSA